MSSITQGPDSQYFENFSGVGKQPTYNTETRPPTTRLEVAWDASCERKLLSITGLFLPNDEQIWKMKTGRSSLQMETYVDMTIPQGPLAN